MARRQLTRVLLLCIALTLGGVLLMALAPMQDAVCACRQSQSGADKQSQPREESTAIGEHGADAHKVAVLVPFRDRFEELMEFVPYLSIFLRQQSKPYKIFVLNQVDNYRFNRASLINVGYLESKGECDHVAMHDVDLLPVNPELLYRYPENGPYHLAAPHLHPMYHYKTFVGGILLVKNEDFEKLNGMSNRYWGWGREDDEFYVRMKKANLQISRPGNLTTGYRSFRHIHDKRRHPRDNYRYFNQREKTKRLDRETGVATVKYSIDSQRELTIDSYPVTILNIKLECNLTATPWCLRPEDHHLYLNQTQPLT
ncbi:beta-1,4-galactosyltransferase 7-like isoform X2 [Babylonia areolata]|uniref:beta-1,4-galactosyltransferase 7-like isoform X2 n=1 Tax=Babylonia areolata TaxID=304850 RepID=UPI003FCEF1B1